MSEIINWKGFEPKGSQNFLIDNSVLLFVFAPIGSYNQNIQNSISRFLDQANKVGSGLHITSLVISEFTNKVFKDFWLEWQSLPENSGKSSLKKDYRPTEQFIENAEVINSAVKNILKIFTRFPDGFNSINMNNVLLNTLSIDYNDSYFIEQSNHKDWIIVTRDYDIINNKNRLNPVLNFL